MSGFDAFFYHGTYRKMVVAFGCIFNQIYVITHDSTNPNKILSQTKVPLGYGPKEKFLRRQKEDSGINGKVRTAISLPRMSFQIINVEYDATRKQNTVNTRVAPIAVELQLETLTDEQKAALVPGLTVRQNALIGDLLVEGRVVLFDPDTNIVTVSTTSGNWGVTDVQLSDLLVFGPLSFSTFTSTFTADITAVPDPATYSASSRTRYERSPFNFQVELNVMVKSVTDGLQIIEQVLPYFTPEYNISVKNILDIDENVDIPVILNSVTPGDTFDGDLVTNRSITWTLNFTMKGYMYPPIKIAKLIKKAIITSQTMNGPLTVRETAQDIANDPIIGQGNLMRVVVYPTNPLQIPPADGDFDITTEITNIDGIDPEPFPEQ